MCIEYMHQIRPSLRSHIVSFSPLSALSWPTTSFMAVSLLEALSLVNQLTLNKAISTYIIYKYRDRHTFPHRPYWSTVRIIMLPMLVPEWQPGSGENTSCSECSFHAVPAP